MRAVKAVLGMCMAVVMGVALSGCVIVPVPYGHGGAYYHYHR